MNPRRGFIKRTSNGKRQAIVTFTGADGKRHARKLTRDTIVDARAALEQLLEEIDVGLAGRAPKSTHELLDWFDLHHALPAEFRDGVKVSGYKSVTDVKQNLALLKRFLPNIPLRSITYDTCAKLRADLLADRIIKGRNCKDPVKLAAKIPKPRSLANVHRILSTWNTVLNTAARKRWILGDPFSAGPALITLSLEKRRERILSWSEETSLLDACNTAPRILLFHSIVIAIESGLREGELRMLKWTDVLIETKVIRVISKNSKANRERLVPITDRCMWSLMALKKIAGGSDRVLSRATNFSTSWKTARRLAKIPGLRFHDLRHAFGTRAIAAGVEVAELARIMGHADVNMTMRYVNVDVDTAQRAGEAITALRILRESNHSTSRSAVR